MSNAVIITDQATPVLAEIRSKIARPRGLMAAVGKRVEKELRAHFLKKNQEGNKKNWPRSNFWSKTVRNATAFQGATDTSATVVIDSPEFVHKVNGGRVVPKRKKFLAIPLTARAKAAGAPGEGGWKGNTLYATRTADGRSLLLRESLATSLRGKGKGKIAGGEAQYLLVSSVTHKADPTALPPEADIAAAINGEARSFFARNTR